MACGFDARVDPSGAPPVMHVSKEPCGPGPLTSRSSGSKHGEGTEEGLGRNNGFVLGLGDARTCSRNSKSPKHKSYESSLSEC